MFYHTQGLISTGSQQLGTIPPDQYLVEFGIRRISNASRLGQVRGRGLTASGMESCTRYTHIGA